MRRLLGLRGRLLGALLLTSAVSLGFAALALLSPLQDQLRRDSEQTMIAAAGAARGSFEEIGLRNGQIDPTELNIEASSLERRTGARVIVFDSALRALFNSEPLQPIVLADVRQALARDASAHLVQGSELLVAQPMRVGGLRFVIALRRRLNFVQESSRVVNSVFAQASLVGLLVALVLGIGLSGTLLRRLARLRDATRKARPPGSRRATASRG